MPDKKTTTYESLYGVAHLFGNYHACVISDDESEDDEDVCEEED